MNVVLSYGDLSRESGYRSRVLGELSLIRRTLNSELFLIVFDRQPEEFRKNFALDVPYAVHPRSKTINFYRELARLARRESIGFIHAHNLYSAALALSARYSYGYKVILDYHGRIPEEFVFQKKGGALSRFALERLEKWVVAKSDRVIVVSEKLREYLASRYDVPRAKLSMVPCCADAAAFRWDPARRREVRNAMKLTDKFVCTHLGSLFQWYEPDFLARTFTRIRDQIPAAHLLVVTPEVSLARDYLVKRFPQDVFTVKSVRHQEVPDLLLASDLGFLLLRSAPNIKTSSPAKFSEYLNCGLPVLITPEVGDFSALVANSGAGAIVSRDGEFDSAILHRIMASRDGFAARCVTVGHPLTWAAIDVDLT